VLTIYRRHLKKCPHRHKGREWKKCACPLWVNGTLDGREIRHSLNTRNLEIAADKVLQIEAGKAEEAITHKFSNSKKVFDYIFCIIYLNVDGRKRQANLPNYVFYKPSCTNHVRIARNFSYYRKSSGLEIQ
jgi:hypothetical protein